MELLALVAGGRLLGAVVSVGAAVWPAGLVLARPPPVDRAAGQSAWSRPAARGFGGRVTADTQPGRRVASSAVAA